MSAAHEGKLMKEGSLQTQSGIGLPSQQRTCMQCIWHVNRDGRKQLSSKPLNLPKLVHCMARLVCMWKVYYYNAASLPLGKWVWPIQCASSA